MKYRANGWVIRIAKMSVFHRLLIFVFILYTGQVFAVITSNGNQDPSVIRQDQLKIQTQDHMLARMKIPLPEAPSGDSLLITGGPAVSGNSILVKVDSVTADKIDRQFKIGRQAGKQTKPSDFFGGWSSKYKVSAIRRVLDGSAGQGRTAVQRLLKNSSQRRTSKETKLLARLSRVRTAPAIPQPGRTYRIDLEIGEGQTLTEAVKELSDQSGVEAAQINRTYQLHVPNDPLYPLQWALENTGQAYPPGYAGSAGSDIKASAAWALHTGDPSIVVAVIDTGLDLTHRDLQANLWINTGEIPGNGIDDDGNGYIDDVHGYDFSDQDADPSDYMGHGTHCGGIIAACGNNDLDITGLSWNAQLMALKIFPLATDEAAFAALIYAADNGADVISCSWGPSGRSPSSPLLEEAIEYAVSMGCIVVFSAGNDNDDVAYYSPANHPLTLAVAASDSRDRKASFSNYGRLIDIAAPGVDILSLRAKGTALGPVYDDFTVVASGTSMACPLVSGACALFLSIDPSARLEEIREVLKRTGTEIPDTPTIGRRLDAGFMAQVAAGKGIVYLDRSVYSCADTISITVIDRDAAGAEYAEVVLMAEGGDRETVFLAPVDSGSFVFRGALQTSGKGVVLSDGKLQIGHGEAIWVSYLDAGENVWISDTAEADCQGPAIHSLDIYAPGPRVVITVEADEPFRGRVRIGQACAGPFPIEQVQKNFQKKHEFIVRGFQPNQTYYFLLECTDSVGNTTLENQNGYCFSFTTAAPWGCLRVPQEFMTIQEAIDRAWEGDQVIVADGTYSGPGNYNLNFYGENIIVRSENGPDKCVLDCRARGRGFVFVHGEDNRSIVDGFTIRNGWAQIDYDPDYRWGNELGGGMYCLNSTPTVRNCRFIENYSDTYGGGLYCQNARGQILLENCQFFANQSGWGGAAACFGGLSADYCAFVSNSSVNLFAEGGGLIASGQVDLRRCFFLNNQAMHYPKFGGAGFSYGGGLYLGNCTARIEQCLFRENQATLGGGVGVDEGQADFINTLICKNTAHSSGGGVWMLNAEANLLHCTVTGNQSNSPQWDVSGGGVALMAGRTRIENSIISGNRTAKYFGQDIQVSGWCTRYRDKWPYWCIENQRAELYIAGSAVKIGLKHFLFNLYTKLNFGKGILLKDPQFLLADDYHLSSISPGINAASKSPLLGLPEWDFEEGSRWIGSGPDIGALEYNSSEPVIGLSRETLYFECRAGGPLSGGQTVGIVNGGKKTPMQWSLFSGEDWIRIEPAAGRWPQNQEFSVRVDPSNLTAGSYLAILQVQSPQAVNDGRFLFVRVYVSGVFSVPEKYPTIQSALLAAHSGETVLVEDGLYTGPGNRDLRFYGKAITLKSRNGPQNCILDCQGALEDPHRGFRLYELQDAKDPVIEGLTIQHGMAGEDFLKQLPPLEGGGIYIYEIKPTIRRCIFQNNRASESGGAVFSIVGGKDEDFQNPVTIEGCIFSDNYAAAQGGGLAMIDRIVLQNSLLFENKASNGGAVYGWGSFQSLINCTLSRNEAVRGGGIFLEDSLENPALNNQDFRMNLVNSIVWENYAVFGSEIFLNQANPYGYPPVIWISHSDVRGGADEIAVETEGYFLWEKSNLMKDPLFKAPEIGDYHLTAGSPCIDAADSTYALPFDLERIMRFDDPDTPNSGTGLIKYVDIGAFEYKP